MKIKGKEIKLKFSLRVMFIYEKLTNKPFEIKTTLDMYILFYAVIMANNADIQLLFDELVDMCDNDPSLFAEFTEWLTTSNQYNSQFSVDNDSKKKA